MQCRNTSRAMASTPFGACSRNAFLKPSILTTEPGCANSFSPPSCSTSFYRERELSLPKFPLVVLIPAADGHPVECLQPQQPTDPAAAEVRLEVAVQCLERKHVPRRESHTIVRHREADHRLRWRTSGTGPPEVELRLGVTVDPYVDPAGPDDAVGPRVNRLDSIDDRLVEGQESMALRQAGVSYPPGQGCCQRHNSPSPTATLATCLRAPTFAGDRTPIGGPPVR